MVASKHLRLTSPSNVRIWNREYHIAKDLQIVNGLSTRKTKCTLYAVIGTWHEEDIVEACISNCLANGCSRVFIIDNDSKDATVRLAREAGAEIGDIYTTAFYDDDLRVYKMNKLMQGVTEIASIENLWWLGLDCDEFPCGPRGERLVDFLSTLDPKCNLVASDGIDLYPTSKPYYIRNTHPADHQSMCLSRKMYSYTHNYTYWKHSLVRTNSGSCNIFFSRGLHTPLVGMNSSERIYLADKHINVFHAQYREEAVTRNRSHMLCSTNTSLATRSDLDIAKIGAQGAIKKQRSLDAIYSGRWEDVEFPHTQTYGRDIVGIALYPWKKVVGINNYPRWYGINQEVKKSTFELPMV